MQVRVFVLGDDSGIETRCNKREKLAFGASSIRVAMVASMVSSFLVRSGVADAAVGAAALRGMVKIKGCDPSALEQTTSRFRDFSRTLFCGITWFAV